MTNNRISIMKRLAVALICAFSAALQYSALRYFSVVGTRPNLPLVATVMTGFALGGEAGALAGFFLGLYQDAQTGKILGMYALFYLYAGVAAGFFPKKTYAGNLPAALIGVYGMSVAYEAAVWLFAYAIPILRGGMTPETGFLTAAVRIIVPTAFLNTFACVPYYFALRQKPAAMKGAN
ncbi:MAG: rod shape-determining protein MreD [Clostridiales bacterium]|jgi:rod shape-determining protein MreD|nr:rod shape-determining protein MreD [Clostridiales bacterium]